jgi:3D (Asp-Asp-Asp) domain-containing protein
MREETLIRTVNSLLAFASILIIYGTINIEPHKEVKEEVFIREEEAAPKQVPKIEIPPTPNPTLEAYSLKMDELNDIEIVYQTIEKTYLTRGYITAYCNCSKCCTYANQPTASGKMPVYSEDNFGITSCAIDPRYYKFGQLFMIDGKIYRADDTGSAVLGRKHFDLFQKDHKSVTKFNTHYTTVYKVKFVTHRKEGCTHEHLLDFIHDAGRVGLLHPRDDS